MLSTFSRPSEWPDAEAFNRAGAETAVAVWSSRQLNEEHPKRVSDPILQQAIAAEIQKRCASSPTVNAQ